MKKIIIAVLVLIVLGIVAFLYETRPVAAPSADEAAAAQAENELAATSSATLYRIDQSQSVASFTIDEMLRGKPFSPVGTTSAITGDILVSAASGTPSATVGVIAIDARTVHTDSAQRDGAINRLILKTGTPGNEYVTFKPTSFSGLPAEVVDGTPFSFTATGDFTISGVTKPETLTITATLSGDTLSGTVSGTLKRSDFNLVIPNIPFVANVSDEFTIKSTFVAKKVE